MDTMEQRTNSGHGGENGATELATKCSVTAFWSRAGGKATVLCSLITLFSREVQVLA